MKVFLTFAGRVSFVLHTACPVVCCCLVSVPVFFLCVCLSVYKGSNHLAPFWISLIFDPCVFLDYEAWKKRADRTEVKGSNYSVLGRTAGNLLSSAPAVQPVHGRVDWTSKYGGNR